jgi:hypothetical protein
VTRENIPRLDSLGPNVIRPDASSHTGETEDGLGDHPDLRGSRELLGLPPCNSLSSLRSRRPMIVSSTVLLFTVMPNRMGSRNAPTGSPTNPGAADTGQQVCSPGARGWSSEGRTALRSARQAGRVGFADHCHGWLRVHPPGSNPLPRARPAPARCACGRGWLRAHPPA